MPKLASMRESRAVKGFRQLLRFEADQLNVEQKTNLTETLKHSAVLESIYPFRQELAALRERSTLSGDELVDKLEDWCRRAEASGTA